MGTSLSESYAAYSYTPNGKQEFVTDANSNEARFVYDGFDRLFQWQFPSKTTPGAVNSADFEQYGYDAVGNRISLKKRDGSTLAYAYDALNRMISKVTTAVGGGGGTGGTGGTAGTLTLSPATLPNGTVGSAYSQTITASGGTAPYTFSATGLPAWLTLTSAGGLSGTPTAAATYSFTINAIDSASHSGSRAYSLTASTANTQALTAVPDDAGSIGCGGISTTLDVIANDTGGVPPRSLVSATAGAGIRVSVVSSTEVQITSLASTGTKSFTYVVQDSAGAQATGNGTVNVTAPCP